MEVLAELNICWGSASCRIGGVEGTSRHQRANQVRGHKGRGVRLAERSYGITVNHRVFHVQEVLYNFQKPQKIYKRDKFVCDSKPSESFDL